MPVMKPSPLTLGRVTCEGGAEGALGAGEQEVEGEGGRGRADSVDVGEDRGLAVDLTVVGEELALGREGAAPGLGDVSGEGAFSDQGAAADRERIGGGRRLDVVELSRPAGPWCRSRRCC